MINIVKCKNNMCIQLPANVVCNKGDKMPCPKNCNFKYGVCSKIEEFSSLVSAFPIDEKKAISALKYSDEEIKLHWREEENSNENFVNSDTITSDEYSNSAAIRHNNNQVITELVENTNEIVKPKIFGEKLRSQSRIIEVGEILKSQKDYEFFDISGKVFADVNMNKVSTQPQPLRNALWEIFSYWETTSVFKSETELKDDFIWLFTTVSKRFLKKSEIDAILLNEKYGRSEKFFYLFYDIIYRYEQPKGFYWCDEELSCNPLHSYFKDKKDFMLKYSNAQTKGEHFRKFYGEHKKEILHFLGCDNEEKLFEDMTLILAKDDGVIVLIDIYNNFIPINMGKISDFIINMQQPTELKNMINMIHFLEKYRIGSLGVVPRTFEYPFEKSDRGDLQEDVSMYASLKLKSSASYASEYDCYVTLLQEYVKAFNPNEIKIGALLFTKNNFSYELEEIVKNLCKSYFGQVSDDVFADYKSRAWLAKSIYDRNILSTYVLENKTYIDKIMQLISNPTFEQYISLFDNCVIQLNSTDLSINEYIATLMQEDIYTVCGEFREDKIIQEFFKYKIRNWSNNNLNKLFDKYQQQYEAFVNA